ncbi:MAG: hypothetical protein JXA20_01105 [Spirochaetes bacterium]|nr:hypothetical protein [Spirochaetota bacterium]
MENGTPVLFNGTASTNPDYYRWSYRECAQSDREYIAIDAPANTSIIPIYFVKPGDYRIKLDVSDGVTSTADIHIEEHAVDHGTRLIFHNNGDGSFDTAIVFSDEIHGNVAVPDYRLAYFDLSISDCSYKHLHTPIYYNFSRDIISKDGTNTGPGFVEIDGSWTPVLKDVEMPALGKEILLRPSFTMKVDALRKAYIFSMAVMLVGGDEKLFMKYPYSNGVIALTDGTIADFRILINE